MSVSLLVGLLPYWNYTNIGISPVLEEISFWNFLETFPGYIWTMSKLCWFFCMSVSLLVGLLSYWNWGKMEVFWVITKKKGKNQQFLPFFMQFERNLNKKTLFFLVQTNKFLFVCILTLTDQKICYKFWEICGLSHSSEIFWTIKVRRICENVPFLTQFYRFWDHF